MKLSKFFAALAIAATIVSPAWAQASATRNASATLQSAPGSLTVTADYDMTFGTVTIPNGAIAGENCFYTQISALPQIGGVQAGPSFQVISRQINGSSVTSTASPSPVGCTVISQLPVPAKFDVTCAPNTPINLSATITQAPSTGAVLSFNGLGAAGYRPLISGTLLQPASWNDTFTGSGTSVTQSGTCSASGSRVVFLSGSISVTSSATPGTDLNVGTLTLSASY